MADHLSWDAGPGVSEAGSRQYDVIIAGGGITGLTLACVLKHTGLRIGVIDQHQPAPVTDEYSLRVSAINHAALQLFDDVGALLRMRQLRVSPFREMHVWDSTGVGQIHFDSAELGLDSLGYIIENNVIQLALLEVVKQADGIDWLCPAQIQSVDIQQRLKRVELVGGGELTAQLVVGADGTDSVVRQAMGIELVRRSYQQQAIVCTVATELDHQQTAWQCFLPSGPLAFLPLGDGHCSIVWSLDQAEAETMMALDQQAFGSRLEQSFEYRLGAVKPVSEKAMFPLAHGHVEQYVQPGLALIGDAAHNVHPLAGQGANLGIMDAANLAGVITAAIKAQRQWSALHTLRKYERSRKGDNKIMEASMTGFKNLFGNNNPFLAEIRNAGLNLVDHVGPLKQMLIQQALGKH
ncbi:MAG: UbiH/UbiF/VisC/COQ6 family ubiquinone biosynthesis hydroxylase [Gammaproteobacteria bacterium]